MPITIPNTATTSTFDAFMAEIVRQLAELSPSVSVAQEDVGYMRAINLTRVQNFLGRVNTGLGAAGYSALSTLEGSELNLTENDWLNIIVAKINAASNEQQ